MWLWRILKWRGYGWEVSHIEAYISENILMSTSASMTGAEGVNKQKEDLDDSRFVWSCSQPQPPTHLLLVPAWGKWEGLLFKAGKVSFIQTYYHQDLLFACWHLPPQSLKQNLASKCSLRCRLQNETLLIRILCIWGFAKATLLNACCVIKSILDATAESL